MPCWNKPRPFFCQVGGGSQAQGWSREEWRVPGRELSLPSLVLPSHHGADGLGPELPHAELPRTLSFRPLPPRGPEVTKLGTALGAAHQRASGTQGRPQDRARVSPSLGLPAFCFPTTPLSETTWPALPGLHVSADGRGRSEGLQSRPPRPREPHSAHLHGRAHTHAYTYMCALTHACAQTCMHA